MKYMKMSKEMRKEWWGEKIGNTLLILINVAFWALIIWAFWVLDWS